MPYIIKKQGSKWAIISKDTGKVVGTADTKEDAEKSARARLAGEHGWKPKGKGK
jgi:hypothetical protein